MAVLVGRRAEQQVLGQALGSDEAELVAIYGRRRVGKTYLIRQFFANRVVFEITGVFEANLGEQLDNFARALARSAQLDLAPRPPESWTEAFDQLIRFLTKRLEGRKKQVVFFDELPWLATRRSGFMKAFEHFWNSWATSQPQLVVVVCGSAASWMINKVTRARGGLHNRVTRRLRLEPFSLAEMREFLATKRVHLDTYQLLETYMAFGGIPHYLKELHKGESAAQAIDRVCFSAQGLLHDEFEGLYASLFEHADRHEAVVRALAKKPMGLTRNELLRAAHLSSGGGATQLLEELEASGFIGRTHQFHLPSNEALFRLTDEYSYFYLKWIEKRRRGSDNSWQRLRTSAAWRAWSGYAFESICHKHIRQIKTALGIVGVQSEQSAWRLLSAAEKRGAQIDLLMDRQDSCINVCEVKFSQDPFVIDKRYAQELQSKLRAFRMHTRTNKTLFLTMVTSCGLKDNQHATQLISNSVTADALFAPG